MSRKNGSLLCIDLGALRRSHKKEGSPSSGVARRTFIAGAAAAAVAATATGKAAAKAVSLGALRIKRKTDKSGNLKSVTIGVDATHAWTLDTSLYDGSPTLSFDELPDGFVLRLENALLPGTEFAINLEARITQKMLSRKAEFKFTKTGTQGRDFSMSADFDAWVRGEAEAACQLSKDELAAVLHNLNKNLIAVPAGAGTIAWLPEGGFAIDNTEFSLAAAARNVSVAGLCLIPASQAESAAADSRGSFTLVEARRSGSWKGRVHFETKEGWKSTGSLKGFDLLQAELHSPESSLTQLSGEGPFDLKATASNGIDFRLDNARLTTLVQPGHKTQVLSAKLHDKGRWLDFPGVSIEIGPNGDDAEALFASIETDEGEETYADIQGGIRNASFAIEGAITRTKVRDIEPITLLSWNEQGTRPPTVRPPIATQPAGGAQVGPAGQIDITLAPNFRLAPFQIEIVRKEDMLALTFEFINMRFEGGGQASITRNDTTKPAYIAVIFPPQNVAEAHFQEGPTGAPNLPSGNIGVRPIPSRLSGESRLVFWIPTSIPSISFSLKGTDGKGTGGLLDWKPWSPSITATAVSGFGNNITINAALAHPLDSVRVNSRTIRAAGGGGPVRIVRPPDGEDDHGLMTSLRRLSARRGPAEQERTAAIQPQRTNVVGQLGRLQPGMNPTLVFKIIPKARIEPSALHTQLEMPIRLILSPNERAGWAHNVVLPTNPPGNRYALWHTRLGNKVNAPGGQEDYIYLYSDDGKSFYRQTSAGAEGPFPIGNRSGPTVRAIDALDWVSGSGPPALPPVIPAVSVQEYLINQGDRQMLVDSMCWRGTGNADTEPFEVENLMLTSLGGYLKGEWVWRQPSGWADASKPALISWRHVATLGRDQFIKIVYKGYLFPSGHKAVLTKIAERKFQTTASGKVVAYVRSRRFIAIRDPLVTFSDTEQRRLGFSSITCTTKESPILDPFVAGSGYATWGAGVQKLDEIMLAFSGGAPVLFQMKGIDQEGRAITWGQPSIFIRSDRNSTDVAAVNKIVTEWEKADASNSLAGHSKRSKMFGQQVAFAKGGGKTPSNEDADDNTSYPANNMMLTGQVNPTPSWPLDLPRWKAELFKANISAPAVQMMQGKPPALGALHMPGEMIDMEELYASIDPSYSTSFAEEDGFDVMIPETFKQNGFGSGNKSQMFLELVEKYAPKFDDTSKSGGIVNPNMLIQGLSKGKGPIGGDIGDILSGNVDPAKLLESGARLLGAVKISDIIPNPIKIDPGGPESPYIEVLLNYDDGKNKPPTGAKVAVIWRPPLKDWSIASGEPPLFVIKNFTIDGRPSPNFSGQGELKLEGSITTKFKGGGKPEMVFKGSLTNFRIDLISPASFLLLDFRVIEFVAEAGKPFDINIDLKKMTFTGPLTFIQKLQDLINGGGQGMQVVSTDPNAYLIESALSTADPGIDVFFDVDETGIRCGLTITVPTVSVGMLAIRNISVGVKLNLPFFGDPLSVRFNFCERNNTFQISVMMVTGGGFVALEINIDGWMTLEFAFEVGGSLSFDIGVASGGVEIMAGIYGRLDIQDGYKQCMIEAYIRIRGNLSVLGIIRINLEFYLSLTYYSDGNRLVGTATLTVEIEILFFSVSVSMTVQRQIAGEKSSGSYFFASMNEPGELPMADQTVKFTEVTSQAQWVEYCEAFA